MTRLLVGDIPAFSVDVMWAAQNGRSAAQCSGTVASGRASTVTTAVASGTSNSSKKGSAPPSNEPAAWTYYSLRNGAGWGVERTHTLTAHPKLGLLGELDTPGILGEVLNAQGSVNLLELTQQRQRVVRGDKNHRGARL